MKSTLLRAGLALTVTATGLVGAATMTPASAAHSPSSVSTVSTVTTDDSFCPYKINGSNVRVRRSPSTTADVIRLAQVGESGYGSQRLYSGSGLTWRSFGGGYVASQYLTRVSGRCVI